MDIRRRQARNVFLKNESYDRYCGHLKIIQDFHSHIHEGRGFAACLCTESLGVGESLWVVALTGERPIHVNERLITISEGALRVVLHVDAVHASDPGDEEIITHNLNHMSDKELGMNMLVAAIDPDVSGATEFYPSHIRAAEGVGGRDIPRDSFRVFEWVLKPNTTYALQMENVGLASIDSVDLDWLFYWLP